MSDTVTRLARAARLLEARGIPVEYHPGWRTRGREALTPAGHVEHDTADPAVLSRTRMLQLLANGHGSLTNALCTWAVPRDRPAAVLIAARTSWHAGRGSWRGVSGNRRVSGTEIQRAQGQTITSEQWDIAEQITRAMVECFPFGPEMVCTHNEWTPRKVDPRGLSGAAWRQRITAQPEPQEDIMASIEDLRDVVREELYDRVRPRQNETVRLAQAACEGTVAMHRQMLGLDPDPVSDRVWAARIRDGQAGITDAVAALREAAAGRQG